MCHRVSTFVATLMILLSAAGVHAQEQKRPNILVIWGDDIGWQNVSAYGLGTLGYTTPIIDRSGEQVFATDVDDPTEDPKYGRVGKQRITDTGPLPVERMKNFDGVEVIPKALDFMKRSKADGKPNRTGIQLSGSNMNSRSSCEHRHAFAIFAAH